MMQAIPNIQIKTVTGSGVQPYIEDLARLRIDVFREFPYLYEGSMVYEREYLKYYLTSDESIFVIAKDNDTVIGMSTGLPILADDEAFSKPFKAHNYPLDKIYYYGESVLLPQYRGQGIGRQFFEARESYVRSLKKYDWLTFCAVQRDEMDVRKPVDYHTPEGLWVKSGFEVHPELTTQFSWRKVGSEEESLQTLRFWLKHVGQ